MSQNGPKIFIIYRIFTGKMFDSMPKKWLSDRGASTSRAEYSDNIELFSREDTLVLNPSKSPKTQNACLKLSLFSLILLLIIAISGIFLIKFSYNAIHLPPVEPQVDDSVSDLIFDPINERITGPQCRDIEPNARFDCNPDEPISQDICQKRGCCWSQTGRTVPTQPPTKTSAINKSATNVTVPPLDVPYCYFGSDYTGYRVTNIEKYLYRTVVTLNRTQPSGFIRDAPTLKLEITEINDNSVRIKFYDPFERRYEVPIPVLNVTPQKTIDNSLFTVKITANGVLVIARRRTSVPVFQTDLKRLIFSDQFLQLSSNLPNDYVYGIGEHKDGFRKSAKQWKRYTLFNRDQYPVENKNLYSSHPFYLSVEDMNGNSNGVFLFNSNAMDVILQPKPAITWRTIGGILDFYVFLGPKPQDVIRQYTELIGLPSLPPYWALGFHICRFGYRSLDNMLTVFNRTRDAKIPFDVQWNDIDAMSANKDFTYDVKNFAKLPQFVQNLHKIGMKYIPMIDPGISAAEKRGSYPPFDIGMDLNIFVKNSTGQPFIGKVWTGKSTVWPDFTDPKTQIYWTQMFAKYHKEIEFDGAWIDMNEPSNFLDGSSDGCPQNRLESPQYTPGGEPLRTKTMCMNARQYAGLHYDLHNLYGISEAVVTNIALRTVRPNQRPVIISRSSFAGHGKYASHWDGDIVANWESMRWSIPSILNFNLFGIPLVGADICGFNGNTTEELCARWSALGAFYPFSRNHNSDDCIDQDPVSLGPTVTAAAKRALEMRYSLLPYFYTLFFRAHTTGDTVVRPLFFEFPTDPNSYEIETQFLWGPAVMVVPTLHQNMTFVNAYLPPGIWYDLRNHSSYEARSGQYFTLDSPLTDINVLLRSGHIVVTQTPEVTTADTRKGDFIMIVGLDAESKANGSLYWDSGDGLDNILLREFNLFEFSAQKNELISTPKVFGYDMNGQKLTKCVILGVKDKPNSVSINSVPTSRFSYDKNLNRLTIDSINAVLSKKVTIVWK